MKRRFNNVLWVMLGLILVMGAVGLGGCRNNEDEDELELEGDVYQGYIETLDADHKSFNIKITRSPYKKGELMPLKNDLLRVNQTTYNNFDLNKGNKLSFRIISCDMFIELFYPIKDYLNWKCEIEILKIY